MILIVTRVCLNTGWGGFSVAADLDEAARISMEAGMDIELCQPTDMRGLAFNRTAGLVRSGRMDVKHLDRAVANLLRCAWLYFGSVRLVFGSISRLISKRTLHLLVSRHPAACLSDSTTHND